MVSAISLCATVILLTAITNVIRLDGFTYSTLAPLLTIVFTLGFLFYRVSVAISSSLITSYVVLKLAGFHLDLYCLISISMIFTVLLYTSLRKREYIPYLLLGGSSSTYFMNSVLYYNIVSIASVIPICVIGYLLQEKLWKTKSKYEKIRISLRKWRSVSEKLSSLRRRSSRKLTSQSL
ncbi:MAG: hypothetical protein RMI56_04695 [Sulfolobales archaeon]|nr:hypothetical protein [Sulfolobales archaeon]MDW8083082.1 hypothetical protein [Sulfolobales archaeon]